MRIDFLINFPDLFYDSLLPIYVVKDDLKPNIVMICKKISPDRNT